MGKRRRRKFTGEFKKEAVRLFKAGERSIGQVAKGRRQNNYLVLRTLFLFQVVIAISSGITRAWQAP